MTPDSLYAALDEPNADINLILGLIADWYEERGDCWRAECLQWCRAEGKRPDPIGHYLGWWGIGGMQETGRVGALLYGTKDASFVHSSASTCYIFLTDAWHTLRERGEVPVAGIAEEVGT